jgi:hypothetical protein
MRERRSATRSLTGSEASRYGSSVDWADRAPAPIVSSALAVVLLISIPVPTATATSDVTTRRGRRGEVSRDGMGVPSGTEHGGE